MSCGDTQSHKGLRDWYVDEDTEVHVVPRLCFQPEALGSLLEDEKVERLVLGLCPDDYSLADIQTEARKLGVDALGVEIIHIRSVETEKARLLLKAAVSRARAFEGSRPEQAKLSMSSRVSRRSLFRFSFTEYRAAPSIDHSICAASAGCSVCAEVCPQDALEWASGTMRYDKGKCEPCGLCVTACPTGAVLNPAITPSQLVAQIRTLVEEAPGSVGIIFHCQYGQEPEVDGGWVPVKLPCAGMARPDWLLTPLLMGAGAAGVAACPPACPAQRSKTSADNVDFCQRFFEEIGVPPELVSMNPVTQREVPVGNRPESLERPFTHDAASRVIDAMAASCNAQSLVLEHPRSPVGIIEIGEACTACGMCAESCPTDALVSGMEGDVFTLTFDAMKCVACSQCLPKCPELARRAIVLHKTVDLRRLREGRRLLLREEITRCVSCGAPIATAKMMNRVEELLGEEHADVVPVLSNYCVDCRLSAGG